MTRQAVTRRRSRRGLVQTGLDFAIGGTAMAIDKASEIVHDARERAAQIADRAVERAHDVAERVEDVAERVEKDAQRVERELEERLPGPDTRPYEERTLEELRELASQRDIEGRSKMNKRELIAELRA